MNTKQFIKYYSDFFERKTRDNGEKFYCLKDNTPDDIRDLNMSIHCTDMLPDDFRYETIVSLLNYIDDYLDNDTTLDELRDNGCLDEIIDSLCDVYTNDLNNWLTSNLNRQYFVDEAVKEFGLDLNDFSITKAIQLGQYMEIQEIAYRMIDEINFYLDNQ